jgi:hypothetical protein
MGAKTGGGGNRPKATRYFRRCLTPASAEGTIKTEMNARIKMINVNFFHIKDPSFRNIF